MSRELVPNIKLVVCPIYDYLASMKRIAARERLNELLAEYEGELELKLNDWVQESEELLTSQEQEQLEFFFAPDAYLGLGLNLLVAELTDDLSITGFINYLTDVEPEKIIYYLVQYIYKGKDDLTIEKVKGFTNNEDDMYDLIEENFQVSEQGKWKVFKVLSKPQTVKQKLISFLENYYTKIYSDEEEKRNKFLTSYVQDNKQKIKQACSRGLTEILSLEEGFIDYDQDVVAAITYFSEFGDVGYFAPNLFVIGYRYPAYVEEVAPEGKDLLSQDHLFKALGDKTRLKMLLELNKGSKYSTELADKLDISTATVNYHVNKFLNAGLIKIDKAENKIYYKLKRDRLRDLITQLENNFELKVE